MRPIWRICLILISIVTVSGDKKYLDSRKVNILVWMLIRKDKWDDFEDYLKNRTDDIPLVSVDTATYKAVEFSIAKGFTTLKDSRLSITSTGEHLYELLLENNIMSNEIKFLEETGKKLSENKIKGLMGGLI